MTDQPNEPRPGDPVEQASLDLPEPPVAPMKPIAQQPGPGVEWSSQPPPSWSVPVPASAPLTAPVEPVTVVRRRRAGFRWAIALVVVALVAGTASAAFFALSGSGASSTVAHWAPAGSIMYAEVRLDLPGDQHAGLAQFLSAFPGFADQSTLDSKLDEVYDRIVRGASNGSQDYSTKVKPWFGGQLALALPTYPAPSANGSTPSTRAAFLASVTDAAKATAWLASLEIPAGSTSTVDYAGVQLTISGGSGRSGEQYAYGVDGPVLVLGDLQSVHDVIDTKGDAGLATTDGFKRALAAYHGDQLGFFYGDLKSFLTGLEASMPNAGAALPQAVLDTLPAWFAMAVQASGDHLTVDVAQPRTATSIAANDRTSVLAGRLPRSTVVELEQHDLGTVIEAIFKAQAAIPANADGIKALNDAFDRVGGLESFTSWIGDTALVVTLDGATWGGGLVVALPDAASAATAAGKLATIKNLASLAGSGGVTVSDATYAGATITTVDLGDLSSLAPSAGLPDGIAAGRASFSYTLNDGLVILGVGGDSVVKAILDAKAGSSLADQQRYKTAIDAAGGASRSQGYLDLRAIIDAVEVYLPAEQRTTFDRDVKPYLDPLQAVGLAGHGGDIQHAVTVLTVGK
jgi:hypothetical protein